MGWFQTFMAAGAMDGNGQLSKLLVAAVGQRYGGANFGGSSTTNRRGRQPIMTGSGTLMTLQLGMTTKTNGNSGDSSTNYPVNFTEIYIEDPIKGTLTPVKYGGATNFTVPGNTAKIFLDEIPAATLGYPNGIPRGTELFIRWDALQAATNVMYGAYNVGSLVGASAWYWLPASGGTVSPVNGFGPITKTGNVFGGQGVANNFEGFGFIVCGKFKESNVKVGMGFGDSLVFGSNATVLNTGYKGFGVVARSSFESDGTSNPIATLIIARPGNDAGDMSGANNATWTWFDNVTHVWEDLCTNDLGATAGNTNPAVYSQCLTRKQSIWAAAKAAGCKVATMMPLPNTTMTAPPSLVVQTDTSNWGLGGLVDQFRDTLLGQVGTNVDACLQFNAIRNGSDRNKWGVVPPYSASPQYHWGDGTTSVGEADSQALGAAELRTFFLS